MILILVGEEKFLHQIYVEEQFGTPYLNILAEKEKEKKKYFANKKAAIGYNYESNSVIPDEEEEEKENDENENNEDEEDDEAASDVDFGNYHIINGFS